LQFLFPHPLKFLGLPVVHELALTDPGHRVRWAIAALVPGPFHVVPNRGDDMAANMAQQAAGRPLFPSVLHILLAIYGTLYLAFVIVGFLPAAGGSPVAASVPYHPFGLEGSLVKIMFAFFLVGFFTAWRNRLVAGVLFVFWWAGMWGLEMLMVARGLHGGAIVMGFPLFVLGVLFIISGYRSRARVVPL
jgi:hypothetical protein